MDSVSADGPSIRTEARAQDVGRDLPDSAPGTQQIVCRGQDVVLQHCSYDDVNDLVGDRTNNPVTCDVAIPARPSRRGRLVGPGPVRSPEPPATRRTGSGPDRGPSRLAFGPCTPNMHQPGSLPLLVRVSRRHPARLITLGTTGCGTEGDNRVNSGSFLWAPLWTVRSSPQAGIIDRRCPRRLRLHPTRQRARQPARPPARQPARLGCGGSTRHRTDRSRSGRPTRSFATRTTIARGSGCAW